MLSKIFSRKQDLKESIAEILEESHQESSPLEAGEKAILKNVLEFKQLHVEDVMIPRADIFAIPEDIDFEELQKKLTEKTYTRIPVYKGDLDEILGFLHIKDVARIFFNKQHFNIKEIIRKSLFVPPSMKVSNLLIRMQQTRVHIAIVVDEYGGTEGIVTLEDIVEEIVGNIEDEHDEQETNIIFKKISDDIFEVSSRVQVSDFMKKSGIDLSIKDSDAEYDTIGGLVSYLLGRIPVKGEVITFSDNVELEVTDADSRTIRKLIIKKRH
jgi:CBS domain containing-hemolysin-like protein